MQSMYKPKPRLVMDDYERFKNSPLEYYKYFTDSFTLQSKASKALPIPNYHKDIIEAELNNYKSAMTLKPKSKGWGWGDSCPLQLLEWVDKYYYTKQEIPDQDEILEGYFLSELLD